MGAIFGGRRQKTWSQLKKRKARKSRDESIKVTQRRHRYFPQVFIWRGHRYNVQAVTRCWTVSRRKGGGDIERHCFRVRCAEGTFDLYQNVRYNTWHIAGKLA